MSYRADPEAFLVREMEEALDPDVVLSVSRSAVLSGPVSLSEAADDAQLRLQSPLHAGILSMEQHVDRIVSGTDAGPSIQPYSSHTRRQWTYTQPHRQTLPVHTASPCVGHLSPRKPPVFTGERGQDFVSWLRTVEDYLDAVPCSEQQAIVFIILLLRSTARGWWDVECVSRGDRQPESLEELK